VPFGNTLGKGRRRKKKEKNQPPRFGWATSYFKFLFWLPQTQEGEIIQKKKKGGGEQKGPNKLTKRFPRWGSPFFVGGRNVMGGGFCMGATWGGGGRKKKKRPVAAKFSFDLGRKKAK